MQAQKTAILFFTRSLEAEFKVKSFGLTKDRFRVVYHSLLKKTYQTLHTTDLPIFEFNSQMQTGNAFGDRLVNALSEIKKKGFDHVIVVGNDTPDLSAEILQQAIQTVSDGQHILGRDVHGGCYLMGFNINAQVLEYLRQVSWHSHKVFNQLSQLLDANTSLPVLADLNDKKDFTRAVLTSVTARDYLIDLFKWIFSYSFHKTISEIRTYYVFLTIADPRGPPALV